MGRKKTTAEPEASQRARAEESVPIEKPDKTKRIERIIEMMVTGAWVTGKSAPELASEWGLKTTTVEDYSAEASRHIKGLVDKSDRAELKARFLAKLEALQDEARNAGRFEAVKGLLELEGKTLGHFEPEKHEISGNLGELLQLGLTPGRKESD